MNSTTRSDVVSRRLLDFVREQFADFLRASGFRGSALVYRRAANDVYGIVQFDPPKFIGPSDPVAFYINAGLVVPRLRQYEAERYGIAPMRTATLADCLWQRTLSRDELGGQFPMLWVVPRSTRAASAMASKLRERLERDVFPWLAEVSSEVAVRDDMLDEIDELREVHLEELILLLEAHGPPMALERVRHRLAELRSTQDSEWPP